MAKALILASISPMIEAFNQKNIELLINMGHEVHVATNFYEENTKAFKRNALFKKQLLSNGIKVFDIPMYRQPFTTKNIAAFNLIKRLIEKEHYAIIHCHSPIGGALVRAAAGHERKLGTSLIYTAHGFHFFKGSPFKNWMIYYPIEKILAKRTDCLITMNREDYQHAVQKKFRAQTIKLINGVGIDLTKFPPTSDDWRVSLRNWYGYKEKDFIMIYVGELSSRKNQSHAIHMMRKLKQKVPDCKLILVGDGEKRNEYQELIKKLDLEENIELLGFRSDISELMSLSDIAISCSRQEGLPVNVMEAMATGLPIVVTNCRGNRDLIHHGENGFVVQQNDTEKFSQYIEKLVHSKPLRKKFSAINLERIQLYEEKKIQTEMNLIYEQFLQVKS